VRRRDGLGRDLTNASKSGGPVQTQETPFHHPIRETAHLCPALGARAYYGIFV